MKKVVLIGSESTGKTELAVHLAKIHNTVFVPELARSYIENLKRPYNYEDVITIAEKQIEECRIIEKMTHKVIFIDTYLIITKIWLSHVFGHSPKWIEETIAKSEIDLFLLCNNDIKWKYDRVRENPDLREYLFEKYKQELEKHGFNYRIISGTGEKRFKLAESYVREIL